MAVSCQRDDAVNADMVAIDGFSGLIEEQDFGLKPSDSLTHVAVALKLLDRIRSDADLRISRAGNLRHPRCPETARVFPRRCFDRCVAAGDRDDQRDRQRDGDHRQHHAARRTAKFEIAKLRKSMVLTPSPSKRGCGEGTSGDNLIRGPSPLPPLPSVALLTSARLAFRSGASALSRPTGAATKPNSDSAL